MDEPKQYSRPNEDLKLVGGVLSSPLAHDNPAALKEQLAEAVSWLGRIAFLKRQAEEEYRLAKNKYLLPKDKNYTDLDRETRVNANVADIYHDYGLLEDLERHLYTRISSCQTLVNSHMVEMKSSLASGG